MDELRDLAGRAGALLKARGERLAVTESTCGGLLSAAFVAQPGASGFYLGGAVIYTREAGRALYRLEARSGKWARPGPILRLTDPLPAPPPSPLRVPAPLPASFRPGSPRGPRTCAFSPKPRWNC